MLSHPTSSRTFRCLPSPARDRFRPRALARYFENHSSMPKLKVLALLMMLLAGCGQRTPDPLLAAGEQALVGSYALDSLQLGPGQLVALGPPHSLFAGMGDTPEAAVKKGLLRADQQASLQSQRCTLTVRADHTFAMANLPADDLTRTVSFTGRWAMRVYHVFETYGYRIAATGGPKGDLVVLRFVNADKPNPPAVEVVYRQGRDRQVGFRFVKDGQSSASPDTPPSSMLNPRP